MPLQFTPARPDAVRAINQRWLLKFWARHLKGARVPRWQAIEPDDLASLSDNLSLLDVTGDAPPRMRIRYHGSIVGRIYGSADCRGRTLDEVIPAEHHAEALVPYHQVAHDRAPVYTIHDITDAKGRLVYSERLLLPFARDGETVDRILVSFEFFCADGAFDAQALMIAPGATRKLRLMATITAQATA